MSLFNWLIDWFRSKPKPKPTPDPDGGGSDGMLTLHNTERLRRGIPTLTLDTRLVRMAQEQAAIMAAMRRLNHDDFEDRLRRSGYPYRSAEENATVGADAQAAWQSWMSSPKHRANATNPAMRDVGFGSVVSLINGQTYWCAVYGMV